MVDREQAIKGLETVWDAFNHMEHELYADYVFDALALLKAQEPVEPKAIDTSNSKLYHNDMFKNYYCGNCGEFLHVVSRRDMFCSQCGRKVKWE